MGNGRKTLGKYIDCFFDDANALVFLAPLSAFDEVSSLLFPFPFSFRVDGVSSS